MAGKLEVEAVAATSLRKLERFLSKQDPYVVFALAGEERRTQTDQDAGAEPRWRDRGLSNKATFEVAAGAEELVIRVMNDNDKKAHTLIGEGRLALADFTAKAKRKKNVDVPLLNKGKAAGALQLFVSWRAASKGANQPAAAALDQTIGPPSPDENDGAIRVTALRAKNLKNVQTFFAQDPYVKVTAVGPGDARLEAHTKESSGTNPVWDSSKRNVMTLPVLSTPVELLFEVFDAESMRSDRLIGAATMQFSEIAAHAADQEILVALKTSKGKPAGELFVSVVMPRDMRKSAAAETVPATVEEGEEGEEVEQKGVEDQPPVLTRASAEGSAAEGSQAEGMHGGLVKVTVLEAVKLKNLQIMRPQDPFVQATLAPWGLASGKTKTMKGRNPKWTTDNELSFSVPGPPAKGQRAVLRLEVMEEEMLRANRLIGACEVDISEYLEAVEPVHDKQLELALQDTKEKGAGKLKVALSFEPIAQGSASHKSTDNNGENWAALQVEGTLAVTAKTAKLTRSVDFLTKQDPLMQVRLLPWGGEQQFGTTKAINGGGKEVTWTEKYDNNMKLYFPGPFNEPPRLHVQVRDKELVSAPRLIGEGTLDLLPALRQLIADKVPTVTCEIDLSYESKGARKACGTCTVDLAFVGGKSQVDLHEGPAVYNLQEEGMLAVTLPYQISATALRGKELKNRALMGKQDPFVKLTLEPFGTQAATQPVNDGGRDVEWTPELGNKMSLPYAGAPAGVLPTLRAEVWDKQGITGDRLIGWRVLGPSCFLRTAETAAEELRIPLISKGGESPETHPAGVLSMRIFCTKVNTSAATRCGALQVKLASVSGTQKADWFSKNDTYVTLAPSPGVQRASETRSVTIANSGLAAEFEETLVVPMFDFGANGAGASAQRQSLMYKLFDKDVVTSDDLLGCGLQDLDETFAAAETDVPHEQQIALQTARGKNAGNLFATVRFVPSRFAGRETLAGLRTAPGRLRIWALEARGLKHVGGMLDFKQDPYLAVALQRPGAPDPGAASSWPKSQRSAAAHNAGKQCVWNCPLDIEHSEADAAYAASGQKPGFLHVAALDKGLLSDTLIGSATLDLHAALEALKADHQDAWVTIFDEGGSPAGEVRIAAEFVPGAPSAAVAKRDDFGYVGDGTLHLLIGEVRGLAPNMAKAVTGKILLHGKTVRSLPKTTVGDDGTAALSSSAEIEWAAPKMTAGMDAVMPVPTVDLEISSSGGFFGSKRLGSCSVPLAAFLPESNDGTSVERKLQLCRGKDFKDTYLTLRVVGIFVRAEASAGIPGVTAGVLAAMSAPAVNPRASSTSGPAVRRRASNIKTPPVRGALPGRLHIRILEGRNLTNKEMMGKQDVYVRGLMVPGGAVVQTAVCEDGGKAPRWTSAMANYHTFLVEDAGSSVLQLSGMDKDVVSDDLIGFVDMPVFPIAQRCRKARKNREPATQPGRRPNASASSEKQGQEGQGLLAGDEAPWQRYMQSLSSKGVEGVELATKLAAEALATPKGAKLREQVRREFDGLYGTQMQQQQQHTSRRERLLAFYQELKNEGLNVDVVKQVDKLEKKYPDTEAQNKSLFTKLYARYRNGVPCPESLWKTPGPEEHQASGGAGDLNQEALRNIIKLVDSKSGPFLRVDADGTHAGLSSEQMRGLGRALPALFPDEEGEPITSEILAKVTDLVLSQLILSGVAQGHLAHSGDHVEGAEAGTDTLADKSDEEQEAAILWWTLRNGKGKAQGQLQVATWFTEDWVPPSREAPPELLVAGTLWVQVQSAELTTNKDWFGKQDPFVQIQWVAGKEAANYKSSRTKPKNGAGKSVEWAAEEGLLRLDYEPELALGAQRLGQTPCVSIKLLDKDMVGSDVIGETLLPLLCFAKSQGQVFPRTLPVCNTSKGATTHAGSLRLRIQFVPGASEDDDAAREACALIGGDAGKAVETAPPKRTGRLLVGVEAARGLRDVKWLGNMAPVVDLRLWPYGAVAATREAKGSDKDATWSEMHLLDTEDGQVGLLECDVRSGKKAIGALQLPLCHILDMIKANGKQETQNWFPIVSEGGKASGELQLRLGFEDDAEESSSDDATAVRFVAGPGTLHVRVVRAVDLRSASVVSKQDPYVRLEAVGWRTAFEAQTPVDENGGRDPTFNFSTAASIQWSPEDAQTPCLAFEVRDRNMMRDTTLFRGLLCVAPWLLSPGQVSAMWVPTYEDGSFAGPYKPREKHGALLLEMQYLPKAGFPGKPRSALSRATLRSIQGLDQPRAGEIHVQVLRGRNLVDVQALGTQDPYVQLTLICGGGEGKAKLHFETARTRQIDNGGSNPQWEEDLLLPYSESALGLHEERHGSSPFLLVEAWDANPKLLGDKLIGRTVLPVFPYILDKGLAADGWFPITDASGKPMGDVHLGIQFQREGEGRRALPSELPENELNVVVVRGADLYNAGDGLLGGAAQDPQVHLEFVGQDRVYKTAVAEDQGTEPVFEERVRMQGCMPSARGTFPRLRVQVYDKDAAGDTFLGMFEFGLTKAIMGDPATGAEPQPLEQWFQLTDRTLKERRGKLQLILRRGPFPDDQQAGAGSASSAPGRVYVTVDGLSKDLTDKNGKPPKQAFVRASLFAGERLVAKSDSANLAPGAPASEGLVLPLPSQVGEATAQDHDLGSTRVVLGVYQRKWTLRGLRPVLVAETAVPKFAKLLKQEPGAEAVAMALPLRESAGSEGAKLGALDLKVLCLPRVAGQLRVTVQAAEGLRKMDLIGKNDLQVECRVVNGASESKMGPAVSTTTKNGAGSGAQWAEKLSLVYSNEFETESPRLVVRVLDKDTVSSDVCGQVSIDLLDLLRRGFAADMGGSAELAEQAYALDKGGSVTLAIAFFPNNNIFKEKRVEESKHVMELKRMWNKLDANQDGQLSREELLLGFSNVPNCAAYLGVDASVFLASKMGERAAQEAVQALFDEMNTNGDEIVDYAEFRAFVEAKPERERAKQVQAERARQLEKERRAAEQRRDQERREREKKSEQEDLERRRLERQQQDAQRRAQQRKEEEARQRREELARKRREAELAKLASAKAELESAAEAKARQALADDEARRRKRRKAPVQAATHKRPADVVLWRTRDVVDWLVKDLELAECGPAFADAAVDGPLLVALTDQDLVEQLGVADPLHRRKILMRAARLFQLHKELCGEDKKNTKKQKKTAQKAKTRREAQGEGANESVRLRLAQQYKKDKAERLAKTREDEMRQDVWKFEYDSLREGALDKVDALDWHSDDHGFASDGSGVDRRGDHEEDEEDAFREAMAQVRDRLVQGVGGGVSRSPANASPPGTTRSRLKSGEHVDCTSPSASRIKSLPEAYWFEDEAPWWQSSTPRNAARIVPAAATAEEVLEVLRQAISELGHRLAAKRTVDTALSISTDPRKREQQRLEDVYKLFCQMKNRASGAVALLTRLKFEGAIKVVLGIDLSWEQFEGAYRLVSTRSRGRDKEAEVSLEEFVRAFRMHGRGKERTRAQGRLRRALFGVCETLLSSKTGLRDLFRGFDRSGDGVISVAEFTSMMRSLSDQLSKHDVFALLRSMQQDLERTISYRAFLDFWLVVHSQWLAELKESLLRSGGRTVTLSTGRKLSANALEDFIGRVEETIALTFGRHALSTDLDALPGPYSGLLRAVGASEATRQASLSRSPKHSRQPDLTDSPRGAARHAVLAARRRQGDLARGSPGEGELARRRLAKAHRGKSSTSSRGRSRPVPVHRIDTQVTLVTDDDDYGDDDDLQRYY